MSPGSSKAGKPKHRGRIQAQGGDTEKSVPWAQDAPPTESEMLEKCDLLEEQLTPPELRDREQPLADLRRHIRHLAAAGGGWAPIAKTFRKRGARAIRVDLEVIAGAICLPDPPQPEEPSP